MSVHSKWTEVSSEMNVLERSKMSHESLLIVIPITNNLFLNNTVTKVAYLAFMLASK